MGGEDVPRSLGSSCVPFLLFGIHDVPTRRLSNRSVKDAQGNAVAIRIYGRILGGQSEIQIQTSTPMPKEHFEVHQCSSLPNAGDAPYSVSVRDVPVDGFWSITVCNASGFMERNELNLYSFNNVTTKPNSDGSITINLGGSPKAINYMPITPGWSYTVRLQQ